jgi:competence protein ComEC
VRGFAAHAVAEADRWALWLPVCLGSGVAAYFALDLEPPLWLGLALACGFGAAALAVRRYPAPFVCALACAVCAVGFAAAELRVRMTAAPVLERQIGPVQVAGRVIDIDLQPNGSRITLDHVVIARRQVDNTPERVRFKARIVPDQLVPGDRIAVRAVLMPPAAPAEPGAFDFARQAWFDRLGAVGYAVGPVRLEAHAERSWSVLVGIQRMRHDLTQIILGAIADPPAGAVASAMITGERAAMPNELAQAWRDSGLAHLLSISGLHMALVAGLLMGGLRLILAAIEPVALRYPTKKWAAAGAIALTFFYLLISGSTAPTIRSFLMILIVLIAVLTDRTAISMRLVAWAAAAILLLLPEMLLGASFQMSFAAVVALIALYEGARSRLSAGRDAGLRRRAAVYIGGLLVTSLIATAATTPFSIYHFNRVALYGIFANLIAVPFTGILVMPLAVAAFILMPFGLASWALVPLGWSTGLLNDFAVWVASWPGAALRIPAMPAVALVVVVLGGLWLCLWRRSWRWFGLAPVAAGMLAIVLTETPDVIVSGSGKLIAVRGADGALALSSARADKIEADTWLRRAAQGPAASWAETQDGADRRLSCDALGCIYRASGRTVALIRDPAALLEDCKIAAVVISDAPIRRAQCRGPIIIDKFKLWRDGAHALWLDGERLRVETVRESRGERPWTARRG